MDADVALHEFACVPYVIERPAEPDVLADAATAVLAKTGLRLEFGARGRDCRERERRIEGLLPDGIGLVSRTGAPTRAEAVMVSGPPHRQVPSAVASAYETWRMVGLARGGYDASAASAFAAISTLRQGADPSQLAAHASLAGDAGHVARAVSLRASDLPRASADPGRDIVENLRAARGFVDHMRDRARKALEAFRAGKPTGFEVREWGSRTVGPSYLPESGFNERSRKTAQGIHPDLLKVVARAQEICAIAFEVVSGTGGVRTKEQQAAIKARGASRAKLGRHTIGHAIDLVPVDAKGRPEWGDLDGFDAIRDAMKQAAEELRIPREWGGTWKRLVDKPHYQLATAAYPGPGEEGDADKIKVAFR